MEEATEALWRLSPSCSRDDWVRILAAFKAAGGDMETALDWSSRGDTYRFNDFVSTWKSLRTDKGITAATLFYLAKDNAPVRREYVPQAQSSTKDYALSIWEKTTYSVSSHPYAIKKRITDDFGAKRGKASGFLIGKNADVIVVPMRDWEGEVVGVECINGEGKKQTFGNKGLLVLGMPEDALVIHITEGWASMWAINQLRPKRFAGVVCFGSGSRMNRIAEETQNRFKGAVLTHDEGKDNRDIWDYWEAGFGEEWISPGMVRVGFS